MSPEPVFIITTLYCLPGTEDSRQVKDYMEKMGQESSSANICSLQSLPLRRIDMLGAFSLLPVFLSTLPPTCPPVIPVMLERHLTPDHLVCPC